MSNLQKEERYLVVKINDLYAALESRYIFEDEANTVLQVIQDVDNWRIDQGKEPLATVVVEKDWPEYEVVWNSIEKRSK